MSLDPRELGAILGQLEGLCAAVFNIGASPNLIHPQGKPVNLVDALMANAQGLQAIARAISEHTAWRKARTEKWDEEDAKLLTSRALAIPTTSVQE